MLEPKTKKTKLSFCSQNEKRDLYAMVTGQTSWTQAGRSGEQMCDTKTETDGDKCDKCEGDGNLAGTCFLHTAGHTPTGWWDQLHRGQIKTDERHGDTVIMGTITVRRTSEKHDPETSTKHSKQNKNIQSHKPPLNFQHYHYASTKSICTNITTTG